MADSIAQARALPSHWPESTADPGPRVAWLFHRLLALVALIAWLSLYVQVETLIGSRGLLPANDFFAHAARQGVSVARLPSLLWLAHSDTALDLGCVLGALISVCALCNVAPRACCALNAVLYLSYTVGGDTFLSFQWDNMLVEVLLLAAFLPANRSAPVLTWCLRLLLFKLYFESGIAKWQSDLGDWRDGSAMTFYYETAPIPTWLAFYAHQLPGAYHHLESWASLFMELAVPFCIFAPRPLRLFACAYFSLFILIDTATANYGFFTYLAATLHVFLLSDRDVERIARRLHVRLPPLAPPASVSFTGNLALTLGACLWIAVSLVGASVHFTQRAAELPAVLAIYEFFEPLRVANVYHLFGHITRERLEPEFQTQVDERWIAQPMWYKPGPENRPPPFVAPHQPRVDFRLWFYGLSFQHGTPRFVATLLDRICHDPSAIQSLFVRTLPQHPAATRIMFHRYRFSTLEQQRQSGAYWQREPLGMTAPYPCR